MDPYSRVVRSGNVNITREPYSGNISTITCNNITETRSYNEWGLLDTQRVKYANQVYYEALYEYDGLQRIKTLHETVLDTFNSYEYEYSQAGYLTTVYKKGTVNEQYSYDSFGNRILFANDYTYNYSYNINRLNEYYWQLSDRTRKVTFAYNKIQLDYRNRVDRFNGIMAGGQAMESLHHPLIQINRGLMQKKRSGTGL